MALFKALKPISGVWHEKPVAVQIETENGFHPHELDAFVCVQLSGFAITNEKFYFGVLCNSLL